MITNFIPSSKKVRVFISTEEELSAEYNPLKGKLLRRPLFKTGIPPPIKPLISAFSVFLLKKYNRKIPLSRGKKEDCPLFYQ